MCLKLRFFFQEWDENAREAFIEVLAQMTSDYIKRQQDYEREQGTKYESERMADLGVQAIGS